MVSGLKLLLALGTLGTFAFYLARVSEMTENAQWGFIGAILLQAFAFVAIPNKPKKVIVRRKVAESDLKQN